MGKTYRMEFDREVFYHSNLLFFIAMKLSVRSGHARMSIWGGINEIKLRYASDTEFNRDS